MKRTLVVIIALLALVPFGRTEEPPKKQAKGKGRAAQHATANVTRGSGATRAGHAQGTRHMNAYYKPVHSNAAAKRNSNRVQTTSTGTANVKRAHVKAGQANVRREKNQFNTVRNSNVAVNRTGNRNVVVNTGGNRRFAVYENRNYATFGAARQYNWHQRHDRGWWVAQSFPLALYGGGYWYWNNGWWYPAYGYDRYYSNYVYDGPIYGYGNVAPGDVTAEVQRALADQGYYRGPIDGILGRRTRGAIERFQANHGLAVTAAIDQPTLASLGLA